MIDQETVNDAVDWEADFNLENGSVSVLQAEAIQIRDALGVTAASSLTICFFFPPSLPPIVKRWYTFALESDFGVGS